MYKFNSKTVTINGQRTTLYIPKTSEKTSRGLCAKRILSGLAIGITLLLAAICAYANF